MYVKFKRLFDVIFSFILLIVLAIPMLLIAIAIKIEGDGSILYTSTRIGLNKKPFTLLKFRSMTTNRKELSGNTSHQAMVTKVGKFIRKTSLDELPQLINILKGDMSFIGPRPWVPAYYENFTNEQDKRADILPGLSGLAQTKGRNSIDVFTKINHDIYYVDNVSFILDLKLLFSTLAIILNFKHSEISEVGIKDELKQLSEQHKTM